MNRLKENTGSLQVFIGGAIWGTIGLFVTKMSECGADSVMISFLRMAFSFGILSVFTIAKYGINAFKVDFKTLAACAMLGLVCHGIYNIFYSLAIVSAGVTISAVLLNIAPVFTAVVSCIFFSEKITRLKAAALVINVLGCILAVTGGNISLEGMSVIGILFGTGAGLCYGLTAIIGKIAGKYTNTFVMSTYSYLFASLFLLCSIKPSGSSFNLTGEMAIWGFLYALIPTAIGYLIYYAGVQKVKESSKVPVLASVETIVAAILGICVNHEVIGIVNILGIAVVILSIVMMNLTARRHM